MSKTYNKLYSKTSKGKINVWDIKVVSNNNESKICTYTGQQDGKITEYIKKVTKGKNIGKKNETTHFEQACMQAQSMWEKKVKKNGYRESIAELDAAKRLMPMCAQYFRDREKYIDYDNACCQPKLDGLRGVLCLKDSTIYSKNGLIFNNLEHILEQVASLNLPDNIVLDGELYTNKFPFNAINGYVRRKSKKNIEQIQKIEYHIFDCFDLDNPEWTFKNRYKYLKKKIKNCPSLVLVKTIKIKERDDVFRLNSAFLEDGYEGIMIRNNKGLYKNSKTRSNDLQKYKVFVDEEFKIINFEEGKGQDEGTVIFVCQSNNKSFKVRPKGTLEERSKMFQNGQKYIGKSLTVKFQEYSQDGVPRFPVGLYVRDIDW